MLTYLNAESVSFWIKAAIDCLRDVSDGMIDVECRHTELHSYITNLGPAIKTFRHYEFSTLGTP